MTLRDEGDFEIRSAGAHESRLHCLEKEGCVCHVKLLAGRSVLSPPARVNHRYLLVPRMWNGFEHPREV